MSMTPQEVSDEARAFERARILALLDGEIRMEGYHEDFVTALSKAEVDGFITTREAIDAYRAALRAAIEKEDRT